MAEPFGPDGQPVELGSVRITAFGLSGTVEVHDPAAPGRRAAELTTDEFLAALAATEVQEQLTIEIAEANEHPELLGGGPGRGESAAPSLEVAVPGPGSGNAQVLLASDEEGKLTWHLPRPAGEAGDVRRGQDVRVYRLPARVVTGGAAGGKRGVVGAVGKRLLKVLVFKLLDPIVGAVGDFFARRWEDRYRPHRLRHFTPDAFDKPDPNPLVAADLDVLARGPALLFVHGTFSTARGAFALMPRAVMERLHRRYQGRLFAFDHPTVSVTPTENVRWLATHLPAGAGLVVDVVSHSRGGLVGRVLCERAAECGLDPDRLRVRTLVMVGTPNAGTPLANDRHIGAFLDTFTNLLEFTPDNPVTDTLEVILTVVKQVAVGALKGLDGLQAQSSEGSYLSGFLNRSSSVKARYRALAANYEPGRDAPLSRFARDHLTDLVFAGAENDLVVPTQGVFAVNGGSGFPIADPVVFPSTDGVEHGGFWSRPRAIQAFDDWLVG